ncbi:hypothetical protein RKE29_20310 [Streptomyces sp. B1866]|uniref:hypothetical protein n=1 Tax=Streptomyces sp. B1866 TaxID=3075431 RepID=UPI002892238E|nr:hypothetical protein [Streptomyces sp. B1866]MDT3398958.1 hypothetical protein [Streptomyces sp. B1866]
MSRTADIDFTFEAPITVARTLGALAASGWSPAEPLGVSYAVEDEDGDLDWSRTHPDSLDQTLATLAAREKAGQSIGISLYHAEAGTGGLLIFFASRIEISFSPRIDRRSHPVAEEFTDLPWYLDSMLPALFDIGLVGYRAQDMAD